MSHCQFDTFIRFSINLTGFSEYTLNGTGFSQTYYDSVIEIIGEKTMAELLGTFESIDLASETLSETDYNNRLRAGILSDFKLGPIARNIIKLWYSGTWYELPQYWREKFGSLGPDSTHVVSTYAYTEGLLWYAVGAHPPGAKAPGYGTWSRPPLIPH